MALFRSFDHCFCLAYCLKSFGGTIREVQSFSLQCEIRWHGTVIAPVARQSSDSVLDPRRCLPRCHRKRCAPNREECILQPAKTQNCDALTAQSSPMPSVPLQQDYADSDRETLHNIEPRLMRAYHLAPSLARSLLPWSLGKRRSLRNATRIAPHSTDKQTAGAVMSSTETVHPPSARSEYHASRIVVRPRNRPKVERACQSAIGSYH